MVRLCKICKRGRLGVLACKEALYPEVIEGFNQAEENCSVILFSPKILVIPSTKPQAARTCYAWV
jgi:hypothetical protein